MKKLSFAMFVIVGLFMLFSGIHSVYGGGKQQAKEAVIVKPRLSIRKHTACIL